LKRIGAYADVQKVSNTKTVRAGQGKFRGKRYSIRKGPLFIVGNENVKLAQAVRNVPGIF
jgi:large subunit ribosomal protein L4e